MTFRFFAPQTPKAALRLVSSRWGRSPRVAGIGPIDGRPPERRCVVFSILLTVHVFVADAINSLEGPKSPSKEKKMQVNNTNQS
jgi:hypothetical protein